MQHACEHQHQRHVLQTLGVAILGPDEVHVRLGQRAIVANAAGQHVLDAALLALVENPGLDDLLRDGFADAADAPHGVNRAHVVMMSAFDGPSGFEVDAKRRPEQLQFDVMHRERVAGEQHVHVSAPDQLRQIGSAAGMHDDGTGDDGDPLALGLRAAHHFGHARDSGFDAPLR